MPPGASCASSTAATRGSWWCGSRRAPPYTAPRTPPADRPGSPPGSASRARGSPGERGGERAASPARPAPPGRRPGDRRRGEGGRGPGKCGHRSAGGRPWRGLRASGHAVAGGCAIVPGDGAAASRAVSPRISGRRLEPRQPLLDGVRDRVGLEAPPQVLAGELVVDPLIVALGGGLLLDPPADTAEFAVEIVGAGARQYAADGAPGLDLPHLRLDDLEAAPGLLD